MRFYEQPRMVNDKEENSRNSTVSPLIVVLIYGIFQHAMIHSADDVR